MLKKIEILTKGIFTKTFLRLLKAKDVGALPPITKNSRLLLIRLNRIGDALVTTPLLKILKEATGCSITVLTSKSNHFVFTNNPYCDEILIYPKGFSGTKETLRKINNGSYDYIIDLHDDVSTTVTLLVGLSKVRYKCGLHKGNEKIFTHTIEKLDSTKTHVIDRLLNFANLLNIKYDPAEVNVICNFPDESLANVNEFVHNNFKNDKPLIGVNISAGSDARFWGIDRYKKLCEFISSRDVNLILISAEKDLHHAEEISSSRYKAFCSPSFDEFAAMISKLDLLLTPDTSAVHLASAYEVPVFAIYARYKTDDMIWTPYKSEFDSIVIEAPNFKSLEYENVVERFRSFLDKHISH